MPGFSSWDQFNAAVGAGQVGRANFGKNFNPTAAAVANEWHTLFRGGGNPQADAIFDAGTNLAFQPVRNTLASAGAIVPGGDVQPAAYKYLSSGSIVSAAATVAPCTAALVDVIGFYRVTTVTTATAQATSNTLGQSDTFTADPWPVFSRCISACWMPMIAFMGVRNSWLTVAINCSRSAEVRNSSLRFSSSSKLRCKLAL